MSEKSEKNGKLDIESYIRVLRLARQPTWTEFKQVALITGAGSIVVGILGFLIFLIMMYLPS